MILQHVNYIGPNLQLQHGDIRIQDGCIVSIEDSLTPLEDEEVLDCSPYIVMPGLANCHMHTPDILCKGLFEHIPLENWCDDSPLGILQQKIFDYEDALVESEDFRILSLYTYVQMLKQGIVFIVESGHADNSATKLQACIEEVGIKGLVDYYDEFEKPYNYSPIIERGFHIPEEEDLTPSSLEKVALLYKKKPAFIMTHCLETDWRRALVETQFGQSTPFVLHNAQLLGPQTILFHCIATTEEDLDLIAQSGSTIVSCPLASIRLSEGSADIANLIEKGIPVTLGTDFIHHNLWEVIRCTYTLLHNSSYGIEEIFRMVTSQAQGISGVTDYTGRIEEGASADLCFLKKDHRHRPVFQKDYISTLLKGIFLHGDSDAVSHVMVKGEWVLFNRKAVHVDEEWLYSSFDSLISSFERSFG